MRAAENELDLDGWERVRGDVSRLRVPSGWIYAIEYCQGDGYRTRHLFVPAQRGYDQLREMAEQMREQRDAALERENAAFKGLEDALTALDAISDSGHLIPDETYRLYSHASEAYAGLHAKRNSARSTPSRSTPESGTEETS